MEDKLVTVILLGENSDDKSIGHVINNIFEQTHSNIDLIVSTFRDVTEEFKQKCSEISLSIRWVKQNPSEDFFKEIIDMADGDYVFYKTLNNILWYPRHIQAHLEEFKKNKNSQWSFSHIEYKDVDLGDHPFNVISYRIDNPPKLDRVTIDEVCHSVKLGTDWTQCLRQDKNGNPFFLAGYIAYQWNKAGVRGCIPPEITVVNWVKPNRSSDNGETEEDRIRNSLGKPQSDEPIEETKFVDGEVVIERIWPTIVGNKAFEDRNNKIKDFINNNSDPADIKSIAIKRTMGMGDVILVEPIIKKLRQKYVNAEINLYTSKESIVQYFENKPDSITKIEENLLLQDALNNCQEELKFDLDLSYESRTEQSFIDSYAEVCFIDFDNQKDKHVRLVPEHLEKIQSDKKIAVVCADGSGWPGKTWPLSYYEDVIEYLQENGYEVIETGKVHTSMTSEIYHDCDFDTMIRCIYSASLYIGGDNGPMHIARGFNVPCVIIAGAALPYFSNPNKDNIYYLENPESPAYGIKHNFFFRKNGETDGITFVPHSDEDPRSGITDVKPHYVKEAIDCLLKDGYKLNISGSFVEKDIIGGIPYYTTEYGLARENKFYHPDQRLDLSEYYEEDTDIYFNDYLVDTFEFVKQNCTGKRVLDVGCNMGIMVNKLLEENIDATGFDLNNKSVEKSHIVYENTKEKVNVGNALDIESYTGEYGAIICNDIIDKVSDPNMFLQNIHKSLSQDGYCLVGLQIADTENLDQRDDIFSIGENVNIFNQSGIEKIFSANGFNIKERLNKDNGFSYFILNKG